MRSGILVFLFLIQFSLSSQEGSGGQAVSAREGKYRMSARLNVSVPHPLTNKAFKNTFVGIYDATATLNFELFDGFTAGAYYKNALFKTPANKVRGLNTMAQFNNGGIRLGMDFYKGNITMFSAGLSGGRSFVNYIGVVCKDNSDPRKNYSAAFIEPDVSVAFFVENQFAIGIQASYTLQTGHFNPYEICLDQHKPYSNGEEIGMTQVLNFGFNLTYSFLRK